MMDIVPQHVSQCSFDFALFPPDSLAQTPAELSALHGANVPTGSKRCNRCKEIKALDQFHLNRSKKDGYASSCKSCQQAARQEHVRRKEDERKMGLVAIPSEKECTKCHRLLPLECFKPEKNSADGRRSSCRECKNARVRSARKEIVRHAENRSEKKCARCHLWLPFDRFDASKLGRSGLSSCCKECAEAWAQSIEQGESIGQKQCVICQGLLPLREFHRSMKSRDGLSSSCRACRASEAMAYRAASKQCSKCGRLLPISEFGPSAKMKDGLRSECRACHRAYNRRYRTPQRQYVSHLRQQYGLTPQDYSEMLTQQGGVCAACKMPEMSLYGVGRKKGEVQPLSVDHDHETGMVRALLCKKCNTALGWFGEDSARIQALAEYAEWCQSLKAPQQ